MGSSGSARRQKKTFDGRRPSMEDDLRWKTTFNGRRPLMEDDLSRKTSFDGRRPLTVVNSDVMQHWYYAFVVVEGEIFLYIQSQKITQTSRCWCLSGYFVASACSGTWMLSGLGWCWWWWSTRVNHFNNKQVVTVKILLVSFIWLNLFRNSNRCCLDRVNNITTILY